MLRLVKALSMQMKPFVQRWRDFRGTEHEHQGHRERTHPPTEAWRVNFKVGGAGDHVRRGNVVTIPNSSSRVVG